MKKKIIIFSTIALFALGLSSCEKILEPTLRTSITEDSALKTFEEVYTVLLGGYNTLLSTEYYGRGFIVVPDLLSDNTKITTSNSNRYIGEQDNRDGSHIAIWTMSYSVIAKANEVISRLPQLEEATVAQKQNAKGQAYFLRALAYHDLARSYAREGSVLINGFDLCVPLVLKPFSGFVDDDTFPERSTVNEVYEQINMDLDSAIVAFGGSTTSFPFLATAPAAYALKARVNLYERDYTGAIANADLAITAATTAGAAIAGTTNYSDAFYKNTETIFGLQVTTTENKIYDSPQSIHVRTKSDGSIGMGGVGYGDITLRGVTWSGFETGDIRKDMILTQVKSSQTVYWSLKWIGAGGSFGIDNTQIIRLSEMYLIKAEAYAELGGGANETLAHDALNMIRTNRGLPAITPSGLALIDAVAKENQYEFLYEGHRFFDLKRRGQLIPKGTEGTDLPYDDYRLVARMPTSEMAANPNLVQNPGY